MLEDEAFPFEEKAIAVHEKNLELMSAGVYNAWIEKSLSQLGQLMPGRYAKYEQSSGLIASVDRYDYRAPKPPAAEPTSGSMFAVFGGGTRVKAFCRTATWPVAVFATTSNVPSSRLPTRAPA